ncbi:MAG: thioesterase family protein [Burkholderiales bacterium]
MKPLPLGLTHRFAFTIPPTKTVPHLYPESDIFRAMPEVLATGYMVGLLEWACVEAIRPYLDWPGELTLGTGICVSHCAATPPGFTVTVTARLERVDDRKLTFAVSAHDGADTICEGTHERTLVDRARFDDKVAEKSANAPLPQP